MKNNIPEEVKEIISLLKRNLDHRELEDRFFDVVVSISKTSHSIVKLIENAAFAASNGQKTDSVLFLARDIEVAAAKFGPTKIAPLLASIKTKEDELDALDAYFKMVEELSHDFQRLVIRNQVNLGNKKLVGHLKKVHATLLFETGAAFTVNTILKHLGEQASPRTSSPDDDNFPTAS